MEYHTDEELNRETEWILKKNRKRRKNASPEKLSQQKLDEMERHTLERAKKGKTFANNSRKSPELPGNV
jgi:hypothetical protein